MIEKSVILKMSAAVSCRPVTVSLFPSWPG